MRHLVTAFAAAGVLASASTLVVAQDGGFRDGGFRGGGFQGASEGRGMGPFSADDRAAFTDARIAALHAGLKLTPDQEKLWPPVEEAIRGFAKERQDAAAARRERFAGFRDSGRPDIPDQLRFMADRRAASAAALGKLADATKPLYAALDDGQKRRMMLLSRPLMRAAGGMRGGREERMRRGDRGGFDFAAAARPEAR